MELERYIPSFTDISKWEKRKYYNTRGSREKVIVVDENEKLFYFKGSKETDLGEVRYPTEFWSEIASSKIGKFLGFDLLDYNIAYDENESQKIGCLSQSMLIEGEETLSEGISYLTGFDPHYNPDVHKKKYTFQFILKALQSQDLEKFVPNLIEVIIFDSIISNSDRHQENWGIISNHKFPISDGGGQAYIRNKTTSWKKYFRIFGSYFDDEHVVPESSPVLHINNRFSPIYDSGCSLGREKEGLALIKLLSAPQNIEKYIRGGKSEIHWLGQKIGHFDLVRHLLEVDSDTVKRVIERVKATYNEKAIISIIENIDVRLPTELKIKYHLEQNRKILMQKLLILRIEKLLSLL